MLGILPPDEAESHNSDNSLARFCADRAESLKHVCSGTAFLLELQRPVVNKLNVKPLVLGEDVLLKGSQREVIIQNCQVILFVESINLIMPTRVVVF